MTARLASGDGLGAGDAEHALGRVDADDLTTVAEIHGELERNFPEATAHVEQPLARSQGEMRSLPRPQPACRLPSGGPIHRGEEHVDVRVIVHPLVAEPMRLACRHAASVRARLSASTATPDCRSARRRAQGAVGGTLGA